MAMGAERSHRCLCRARCGGRAGEEVVVSAGQPRDGLALGRPPGTEPAEEEVATWVQRAWAAPRAVALRAVDLNIVMNRQKNLLMIAKDVTETGSKHLVRFGELPGKSEPLV